MKPARIIVLVTALLVGGLASWLASRPGEASPAPQVQLEVVEGLVATKEITVGTAVPDQGALSDVGR